MNGALAHAVPEQQLKDPTSYSSLRRHELHKIALEQGIMKEDYPTPTKDVLVAMLEGTIPAPECAGDVLSQLEQPVPLNQAHLSKPIAPPVAKPVQSTDDISDLF